MAEENNPLHGADEAAKEAAKAKMTEALKQSKDASNEESEDLSHVELEQSANEQSSEPLAFDKNTPKSERNLANVKVYSPFHVYYDSDANSISAVNLTGPFDILYGHKNFMSILSPGEIVIRSRHGEEHIKIERGVMHVRNNSVTVFLDV